MLIYWIWFAQLKKLSHAQKMMLLRHFRDPEEIYHSQAAALADIDGITEAALEALEDRSLTEAEKILEDCVNKGIGILTLADRNYPARLKVTYDPPFVLYFKGKLPQWEEAPIIGIVGTRKASTYGMRAAYKYGAQIAACGGIVISGGAKGIDTMALEGALAAEREVLCVFGCGVDVTYPRENRQLFAKIAQQGCLLSEYPPRTSAHSWNFPRRNRIISGISNGLLVVEAPERSGALNTARHAMEQGRDVFVVPGNVDEASCAGSNGLLQDYGAAALSGWDVMKEYQSQYPEKVARRELPKAAPKQKEAEVRTEQIPSADKKSIDKEEKSTYSVVNNPTAPVSDREQAVLAHIGREPVTIDEVIEGSGIPAAGVKAILTKLTIKGLLRNHPGGRVSRK